MYKATSALVLGLLMLTQSVNSEDCSNFNGEMGCTGGQVTKNPDDWANRSFQTFLPGDPQYKDAYEGLGRIMCYSSIIYSSDRNSATVDVRCRQHSSVKTVSYDFSNQGYQSSNTLKVDTSVKDAVSIKVQATDSDGKNWEITLESINFIWQAATVNQGSQYNNGQKGAIIEMFGWGYEDIKAECPYLGKMGWMGVKVFPPQESVFSMEWPQNGELNPWWFYYQPVSYKLNSRHGTRDQLRDMIQTCRSAGVRIYADAVVNHMSGGGNDVWADHRNGGGNYCTHWGAKSSTGSSPYFTHNWMWSNSNNTGLRPALEYPAVPYIATDFHCERSLNSWGDPFALNNGWLSGLTDLDTESEYVRERIASYFVDLLSIGFSGFRIDAAKHIQPKSIAAILAKLKANLGGGELPADFITWLEVLMGGEKDLLMCQESDYQYGTSFAKFMANAGLSNNDVLKVKIWESDYPKEFPICGYWSIPSERYVSQNDCHDDQNPGSSSRDMGDKGSVLVQQKDVGRHRGFETQLFSRTDGNWQIRLVLSSYTFMNNGAMGIPDGKSDCKNCVGAQCNSCSKSMPFSQAFDANSCGYDCTKNGSWQEGVYTRVHRDIDIIQAMRKWQGLSQVNDAASLGLPANCKSSYLQQEFLTLSE